MSGCQDRMKQAGKPFLQITGKFGEERVSALLDWILVNRLGNHYGMVTVGMNGPLNFVKKKKS